MGPTGIDCVVVGYNDTNLDGLLKKAAPFRELSGGYRHLLVNSLPFSGRRVQYSELLNACIERGTGQPSRRHVGRIPNLGACYLVSFLTRRGFTAELVNFFNHEREEFAELLRKGVRSVALTTTYYFDPAPIQELVQFIRERSPDTTIVVGGPHIFNVCTDTASDPTLRLSLLAQMGADIYVFDSQGELTLSQVCEELRGPRPDLSRIPNLVYSTDGWKTLCQTARRIEDNDMSANVVDWSGFSPGLIAPTVQTRTARSCAFKCAFCRYPVMAGALNLVDLDTVERELDYFQSIGIRYVLFIDDTFNIPEPRFKALCRRMIAKRYDFEWFSYFRCANADDECFDLMAQARCKGVFLGIESGDNEVLRHMRKAAKVEKYLYGIRKLTERNIVSYASFIVGHPGETPETARNTFRFIDEARPTFYCIESFFFDAKTPIGARAADYQLQGAAYRWQHNGMDWRKAAELVEEGYRSIKGSTVVPLYSFDLWSFAYILGTGVEESKLMRFLESAAELLIDSMDQPHFDGALQERELGSIFASRH